MPQLIFIPENYLFMIREHVASRVFGLLFKLLLRGVWAVGLGSCTAESLTGGGRLGSRAGQLYCRVTDGGGMGGVGGGGEGGASEECLCCSRGVHHR